MKPRPWIAATERHVDGIPFGETVRPGDAYTSVVALTDGDVDLLALIKDTADRLVRLAHDEADHGRRAELNGLAIRLDNVGSLHDA